MRLSPTGLAIVKAFESCLEPVKGRAGHFKPYVDPVGVLTIGWGHTNHHEPKFTSATVWSQQQCDDALAGDMALFEAHVSKFAKVDLSQNEFDALVSWAYNTGGPETATLWRKLNAGDRASVPKELAKWNRGGGKVLNGLTRRRKAEGQLFVGDVAGALQTAGAKMPAARTDSPAAGSGPPDPMPAQTAQPPSAWTAFFTAVLGLFRRK